MIFLRDSKAELRLYKKIHLSSSAQFDFFINFDNYNNEGVKPHQLFCSAVLLQLNGCVLL